MIRNKNSEEKIINLFQQTLREAPPTASIDLYFDSQIKYVLRKLNEHKTNITLLDYGCGEMRLLNGIINSDAFTSGINYTGTDIVEPGEYTKKSIGHRYSFVSCEKVRQNSVGFYDVIVLMNVIHEISIYETAQILEDARRYLNEDGKLLLVDMSVLPEGEPLALPFYQWDLTYIFKALNDDSYVSKSGIPIIAAEIEKNNIYMFPIVLEKLIQLVQMKRNTFSEMACMLNKNDDLEGYAEITKKMCLGANKVYDLGLLMLLAGHANYRWMEEVRREQPQYNVVTEVAVSILKMYIKAYDEEKKNITPNQIFQELGKLYSYDSIWFVLENMTNKVGNFFIPLPSDYQDSNLIASETLDAFEDYFDYEDIGKMGLGVLQTVCHRKCWPDG